MKKTALLSGSLLPCCFHFNSCGFAGFLNLHETAAVIDRHRMIYLPLGKHGINRANTFPYCQIVKFSMSFIAIHAAKKSCWTFSTHPLLLQFSNVPSVPGCASLMSFGSARHKPSACLEFGAELARLSIQTAQI